MSEYGGNNHGQQQAANAVDTGGVFELVDVSMFPVTISEMDIAAHVDTDIEAMMSKEQVRQAWTRIFTRYGVTADDVKRKLIVGILRYFILNGSSPRAPYDGNVFIGQTKFAIRKVKEVLGRNVRRFCRSHADTARSILKADEVFAQFVGNRFGFAESYDLAFDFADYCSGLTEGELDLISSAKRRTLANTTPYKPAVDVTTPSGNTGGSIFYGESGNGSQYHQ